MLSVSERLQKSVVLGEPVSERGAEEAVLARLKSLGIRPTSAGGGSWTSTERTASPLPTRAQFREAGREEFTLSSGTDANLTKNALLGLPSLDGLLGTSLTASLPKVGGDGDGEESRLLGGKSVAGETAPQSND